MHYVLRYVFLMLIATTVSLVMIHQASTAIRHWTEHGTADQQQQQQQQQKQEQQLQHEQQQQQQQLQQQQLRPRILCLVLTQPKNYVSRALPVMNTWGSRCTALLFVGSRGTKLSIPLLKLNIKESRDHLWRKVWMGINAADKRANISQFDYVLKADDDTFVVMENLRHLLRDWDPNKRTQTGRLLIFAGDRRRVFASGGAGYVMSRAAVLAFMTKAIRTKTSACNLQSNGPEDVLMSDCLRSLNVSLLDSRDKDKLETFHPENVDIMLGSGGRKIPGWLKKQNYYPLKVCPTCLSSRSVSFHYVHDMYKMEYLIYRLVSDSDD